MYIRLLSVHKLSNLTFPWKWSPVTDFAKFVEGLREQKVEQAYWRALEQFFGLDPSSLKSLARQKCPDATLPERERVEKGLKTLISEQADSVQALAKTMVPVGNAVSWTRVANGMDPADHVIQLCTPEQETSGMLEFLRRRANTDGKVFCLWHGDRVEAMREALVTLGYGKMLETGKIVLIPIEKTREIMVREGNVDAATGEFGRLFDQVQEEEYPEFSLGGSLAGSLYRGGYYDLARDWEAFLHRSVYGRNGVVYCPYPILNEPLNHDALRKIASVHNWMADGNQAYRLDLASTY